MKRIAIMLALLALIFSAVGGTEAFARPHGRGHMGCGGPDMGFGMLRMLDRLELSRDQEHQVAALLKSHREEIGQLSSAMEQARSSLKEATLATEFSEENTKQAARAVAEQQEQMILLRAKVMNGIRAVLTPEQNERMQEVAGKRAGMMKGFVDSRLAALDSWIAEHSN